jgi:hypothetical protein
MSSPFIFIAINPPKPSALERERKRVPGLVEFIEANESRLIAFNEYLNETGDEVTVVQIHPTLRRWRATWRSSASGRWRRTRKRSTRRCAFRSSASPTDAILELLRQQAESGVEVSVNGEHLGGFTRSAAQ